MKNQLVTRHASVKLLEEEKEKEHSKNQNLTFEIWKLKSEASDTVKLQKDLNDYQQKCATQEDSLKEAKSKLKNRSKSYSKMLERLDRKQQQLTKFKTEQVEQAIKLKQSAKEIRL